MGRLEGLKDRLIQEFRSSEAPPTLAQQLRQQYTRGRATVLELVLPVGIALVTTALTKDPVVGGLVGLAVLSMEELAPMDGPVFN